MNWKEQHLFKMENFCKIIQLSLLISVMHPCRIKSIVVILHLTFE